MILTIYGLKNRLSGIFEKPITELHDDKEYVELLTQSLAVAPVDILERHKEYDIYKLGSFDTKSGVISSVSPVFVMSLEQICNSYLEHKNAGKREETVASV